MKNKSLVLTLLVVQWGIWGAVILRPSSWRNHTFLTVSCMGIAWFIWFAKRRQNFGLVQKWRYLQIGWGFSVAGDFFLSCVERSEPVFLAGIAMFFAAHCSFCLFFWANGSLNPNRQRMRNDKNRLELLNGVCNEAKSMKNRLWSLFRLSKRRKSVVCSKNKANLRPTSLDSTQSKNDSCLKKELFLKEETCLKGKYAVVGALLERKRSLFLSIPPFLWGGGVVGLGFLAYFFRDLSPVIASPWLKGAVLGYLLISVISFSLTWRLKWGIIAKIAALLGVGSIVLSDTIISQSVFLGQKEWDRLIIPTYLSCHTLLSLAVVFQSLLGKKSQEKSLLSESSLSEGGADK